MTDRTAAGIAVAGPTTGNGAACDAILRALPDWFGIESAIVDYSRAADVLPGFLALDGAQTVGIATIKRHFAAAAEVHVMGVRPQWHRRGVGRALLGAAERWLLAEGVRFLQVKTLGPSRPDPNYARTHAFYASVGFVPLEEIPTLWGPRNPCLIMVKPLVDRAGGQQSAHGART